MPKKKYELSQGEILEKWAKNYPEVITWVAKLKRREEPAWRLWLYCRTVGKNPTELLALKADPKSKEAEHLLDSFIADKFGKFTNSVKFNLSIAVKSFYKHNYCDLARAAGQVSLIKQKPYRRHSKEEMQKIYRAANNPRDRCLISFVWSTAVARESLSLARWDNLEPNWENQQLPALGLQDTQIKGGGHGRYKGVEQHSFLTPTAKKDLLDYRDWLTRVKGLKISNNDIIFRSTEKPFGPITQDILTQAAVLMSGRSGVKFSWHDGRRYVETALESTKINPNWARKIRGRKVRGEESPYSQPAVEELRKAYAEAVNALEFTTERPQVPKEVLERMAQLESEQAQLRAQYRFRKKSSSKTEVNEIEKKLEENKECEDGKHCQQIVTEENLADYLSQGWKVTATLPSGKIVIES